MVITLAGTNDFARGQAQDALVADFLREYDEFGLERLDGEETTADQLQAAVQSLPFLCARKLVILREPSKQKTWVENFDAILPTIADQVDVVVVEPKLDKRLSYYKTLKKQTDFREYNDLDASGLVAWVSNYAKKQGGNLTAHDARLLLDRAGPNQQLLQQELDKLLAYSSDITKTTIELLVEPTPQSTVFELLDAAFAGKAKRALQLYHEQRALKVEPQAIMAMLAWQLHVLALLASAGGQSGDDIARAAKLNPFVVRKSQTLAQNLGFARLKRLVHDLLKIDIQSKTTAINLDEALQLYLIALPTAKFSPATLSSNG